MLLFIWEHTETAVPFNHINLFQNTFLALVVFQHSCSMVLRHSSQHVWCHTNSVRQCWDIWMSSNWTAESREQLVLGLLWFTSGLTLKIEIDFICRYFFKYIAKILCGEKTDSFVSVMEAFCQHAGIWGMSVLFVNRLKVNI